MPALGGAALAPDGPDGSSSRVAPPAPAPPPISAPATRPAMPIRRRPARRDAGVAATGDRATPGEGGPPYPGEGGLRATGPHGGGGPRRTRGRTAAAGWSPALAGVPTVRQRRTRRTATAAGRGSPALQAAARASSRSRPLERAGVRVQSLWVSSLRAAGGC